MGAGGEVVVVELDVEVDEDLPSDGVLGFGASVVATNVGRMSEAMKLEPAGATMSPPLKICAWAVNSKDNS